MSISSPRTLLENAYRENRLSHAYLLSGPSNKDKTQFAREFGAFLLCESNVSGRCGQCRSCHLMQANHHPDFLLIEPHEKNHAIKIDQIRTLIEKITKTAHAGRYRVVIITPADAMPVAASNALLKTLEEPVGKTILFLVEEQAGLLPLTILSRCQKIIFSSDELKTVDADETLACAVLSHLENILLRRANPIVFPIEWIKVPTETILEILLKFAIDLSRIQQGIAEKYLLRANEVVRLSRMANQLTQAKLQSFLTALLEKKSYVIRGINLNAQLCLESLFIQYGQ